MTTEQRPVGMAEAYAELRRLQALERKQKLAELDATANTEVNAMSDAMALMRDELAEWKARAEEAEATIARVREVRNGWSITLAGTGIVSELDAALDPKPASKQVILTADMAGVKVNGYDFTKGVIVTLPTEDADRLIGARLAKEAES